MSKKTWFISGISSGLGKAIAQTAMANGDRVIGTFRQQAQVDAFHHQHQDKGFAIKLDITRSEDIQKAVNEVTENFGHLDVLVNNAGFGLAGAIEEISMTEARAIFDANFFGTLQLTQGFLPLFRQQKQGHIVQISSHGGFKAFPGFGLYNASKFALEGFSEALAQELAPLGIKLTLVEPGPFRTNFAGSSFRHAAKIIADYQPTAGAFKERMKAIDGQQEGDPLKAAQAIAQLVMQDNPPLRLPLGKIAIETLLSKIKSVENDLNSNRQLAESVVFQ